MSIGEFGMIDRFHERLKAGQAAAASKGQAEHVIVGIGDDAAVTQYGADEQVLVTTDTMVEGHHWLPKTLSWYDVGWKAMAASISDIAAMGGEPRQALVALAARKDHQMADLEALYDGMAAACSAYGCAVIGGDLVATPGPLVVTTTLLGAVPKGQALLRSGARSGDMVFVTGHIGGSDAGLDALLNGGFAPDDELGVLHRFHQHPQPQVTAGTILRTAGAASCNDISDGLASELNEIAAASHVRMRIEANRIPLHPAVRNWGRRKGRDPLEYAWYGGEDYQLVGTASPFSFARALAQLESLGIQLTAIGRVEPGDGVVAQQPDGRLEVIQPKGHNHFA